MISSFNDRCTRYGISSLINLSFWLLSSIIEIGAGTVYPPSFLLLSSINVHSGGAVDFAIFSFYLVGISSILGAIIFVVTIIETRVPGFKMRMLPLFVLSVFIIVIFTYFLTVLSKILLQCFTIDQNFLYLGNSTTEHNYRNSQDYVGCAAHYLFPVPESHASNHVIPNNRWYFDPTSQSGLLINQTGFDGTICIGHPHCYFTMVSKKQYEVVSWWRFIPYIDCICDFFGWARCKSSTNYVVTDYAVPTNLLYDYCG